MSKRSLVSIVDDDESVRQALESLFRAVGFQVGTFASAEDFLGSRERGTTGCLILDLRMSGIGGLELQQRLAGAGRRLPIVILTAHADHEARARALRAGAAAFLPKPFDAETLLSAVEAAWMER